MTATIIPMKHPKGRAHNYPDRANILTREIMREYAAYDVALVHKAIDASSMMLGRGGTFYDAMEAADRIIREASASGHAREEVQRNFERMMLFRRRRERLAETLLCVTEVHIRFRMRHSTELEIAAAIERARRVLEGGGDIVHALHLALPDDLPGAR